MEGACDWVLNQCAFVGKKGIKEQEDLTFVLIFISQQQINIQNVKKRINSHKNE